MQKKIHFKRNRKSSLSEKLSVGILLQGVQAKDAPRATFGKYESITEDELKKLVDEGKILKVEDGYQYIESERYKEFYTII